MTNNDLLQKINELENRVEQLETVRTPNKSGLDMNPSAIWTPKHIAKYTGFSYGHIKSVIVKAPDFPAPVQESTATQRKRRLYLAGDIIAYFKNKTQK